jgi:hypothetical protein
VTSALMTAFNAVPTSHRLLFIDPADIQVTARNAPRCRRQEPFTAALFEAAAEARAMQSEFVPLCVEKRHLGGRRVQRRTSCH